MANYLVKNKIKYLLIALLFALPASALTISTRENINEDCNSTNRLDGCYFNNTIYLKNSLPLERLIEVLLHELGHWKTAGKDTSLFKDREDAAEKFALWTLTKSILVTKPYFMYYRGNEVYEYQTGRHISYEEAVKNNIWDDIQLLPTLKKIVSLNEKTFFEQL